MNGSALDPGQGIEEFVDWWKRARLIDYLLALNNAQSRLPWVGRYMAELGSLTALGFWGVKHAPEIASTVRSRRINRTVEDRRRERKMTAEIAESVLAETMAKHDLTVTWPQASRVPPVVHAASQRRDVYAEAVAYGDHPDQVLDVWRLKDLGPEPAPVLLFIPGGAWVFGKRLVQGHSLMSELASQGWICLSVQYRAAPSHRWPACFHDVKRAIGWARDNVARYGGDSNFIALAGCSAGGHLASLAGLTANDARHQTHLSPGVDTAVDAVVSLYGRYDWRRADVPYRADFVDFLERVVVQRRYEYASEVFTDASPVSHVHAGSPPFFVVHGGDDSIIPVGEAREFSELLTSVSGQPVTYFELPGAEHAFDLIDGARTGPANTAVGVFLQAAYRDHQNARHARVASL